MKWLTVICIVTLSVLIIRLDWPQLASKPQKDKVTFIILTAIGCLLGIVLVYYPDLPGPTQFTNNLYKPFGSFLEK